jgi:triosephosphate isomerase
MRVPFIAGNWKMNGTVGQAVALAREIADGLDKVRGVEVAVCPPYVSITTVSAIMKGTFIGVGAQNAYYEEHGAYTGEISLEMLDGLCRYVIIGHSERRQYFGDTDQVVARKLAAVLKRGFIPILCIGEKLDENEAGKTEDVLKRQVGTALSTVKPTDLLIIAYEPVWAIGTGRAATVQQAGQSIAVIRALLGNVWGRDYENSIRVLYGGSVTSANTTELMSQPLIDGALVGGASLKAKDFISIVTQAAAVKSA